MSEQTQQIQIRDLRIKQDEDQLGAVTKDNEVLTSKINSWYRSPYLWVVVGIVAGVYAGKKL